MLANRVARQIKSVRALVDEAYLRIVVQDITYSLQGAEELRGNVAKTDIDTAGPDMAMALTTEQVFDSLAIRVNGPRAWDTALVIDWIFTDLKQDVRLQLSHGALIQSRVTEGTPAQLRLTLTKPQLLGLLATQSLDGIDAEGDPQALTTLLALLDTADKNFAIVTP